MVLQGLEYHGYISEVDRISSFWFCPLLLLQKCIVKYLPSHNQLLCEFLHLFRLDLRLFALVESYSDCQYHLMASSSSECPKSGRIEKFLDRGLSRTAGRPLRLGGFEKSRSFVASSSPS